MNVYLVERFLHIIGAFGFIAAHGATAVVTFKMRHERDPAVIRTYLDLSRSTRGLMYGSFLLLLVAGILMGFHGAWWGMGWIWTALVLLALLFGAAFPLAIPYFRAIRRAVEEQPVDRDELAKLLSSPRGLVLAWVETLGMAFIIYLMVFKPF